MAGFLHFQLHCDHNQVMVAVDIRSRECSALGSVDAGLESPLCANIVNLVVLT